MKTVFKKYHITIIKAVKTKPKPVHTPGKKNKNINNKKISRVQRSGGTDLMDQGKVKHQFQYGDCNVQDCGQNVNPIKYEYKSSTVPPLANSKKLSIKQSGRSTFNKKSHSAENRPPFLWVTCVPSFQKVTTNASLVASEALALTRTIILNANGGISLHSVKLY